MPLRVSRFISSPSVRGEVTETWWNPLNHRGVSEGNASRCLSCCISAILKSTRSMSEILKVEKVVARSAWLFNEI